MKVRFVNDCHDKYNGTPYRKGDVLEFEYDRALEIIKTGYAIGEFSSDEVKEEDKPIKLTELTKEELIEVAKENNVSYRGSKNDIIKRLLDKQDEL